MKLPHKVIIIALTLFTLQGCGIQFWYNRIAWLSTWYADDYVTLSSAQEDRIEELVEKHAHWHRTTQLPRYNQFISEVTTDVSNHNLAQNFDRYSDQIYDFYQTILTQILDDTVRELSLLSDEQVVELMQNIQATAQEQTEEYLEQSPEERYETSLEESIEYYEDLFDDLTDKQRSIITQMVTETKPIFELREAYLSKWRQAFKLALDERHTESGQKALYSLMEKPRQLSSPSLFEVRQHNSAILKKYLIQLFDSLSDEQIEHFTEFLADYKADFNELIDDVR